MPQQPAFEEATPWWGTEDTQEDLQPAWMNEPEEWDGSSNSPDGASATQVGGGAGSDSKATEVRKTTGAGACCMVALITMARILNIIISLFIIALVLGGWFKALQLPFPKKTGFWKYPSADGINDICIAVQAFIFAFIMIAFELSMLLQRRAMCLALFTFRWFGFMMAPQFAILFTGLYALLACTLSYWGIIAGCVLFANSFWMRLVGRSAAKKKAKVTKDTTGETEMTNKDTAINDRTAVRDTIRGQVNKDWGQSYFNSAEGKASFKPWIRPLFLLLTAGLNAATMFLLLIIEFPTKIVDGIFHPSTVYLLCEAVVLCLIVLMNELVSCTVVPWPSCKKDSKCICSQNFVKAYLGFLVNDRARIGTFILQGFVTICITGVIPIIFGSLLIANALLQVVVMCGCWGHKSGGGSSARSPRADTNV